jgi:hypothetical protein
LVLWANPFIIFISLHYAVNLIAVCDPRHARHDTENVVVHGIDTDLSSVHTRHSVGGKHELKDGIVNSGEVAAARRLVLLGAKGKGVHIDTAIGGTCVMLERLDNIEVRTLTLREAILAVKLELSGNNGVLTPAVHVKGRLSEHECTGVRERRTSHNTSSVGCSGITGITSCGCLEKTLSIDEFSSTGVAGLTTESMDGIGKSVDGIGVVERLGTKSLVKKLTTLQRGAVINITVRLDNPDKLLARVVEVELDLVGGRTNRLVTSELKLLNQVLVRVLGHLASLVGIKEDIVDVKRSGNKGLLVSHSNALGTSCAIHGLNSPQALTNRTEVNVDLNLVVLKSNQRKSKSGVAAKPEKKRHVKSGLRKGLARSTHLGRSSSSAGSRHLGKIGVSDVCKLSGVTNHLVVTSLLLLGKSKLVPDVHPVTVLTVNALTTNLNLNLGNKLLTDEV